MIASSTGAICSAQDRGTSVVDPFAVAPGFVDVPARGECVGAVPGIPGDPPGR